MKKKITNRIWWIIPFMVIVGNFFGISSLFILKNEITWLIATSIMGFSAGNWWLIDMFTKKGRSSFIRAYFSCFYLTDDAIVLAAGKKVYYSLNKDNITQIVIGKMNLGLYGSKKRLIALRKENSIVFSEVFPMSLPPNKIIISFPYSRKKIIEEWWGQPIEKSNISF